MQSSVVLLAGLFFLSQFANSAVRILKRISANANNPLAAPANRSDKFSHYLATAKHGKHHATAIKKPWPLDRVLLHNTHHNHYKLDPAPA
ncbi:hypothetical protein QN372_11440 [Undibacterium sp. RTI2.1]|uniref:hypothetical protein n=1 Tax=unclassified Undibacterium TaxID=2630295 RepID=UPI002AB4CD6A|nr:MULTISPECIES: hypothetical protein [unclassified Undibacterium]MDY7538989.1 hypothetical protein [Undibacterium sp. 5I1]MEB0031361.1 hypothetical protein [Undibacterium sp. RTI2.1]MEB0117664.1 hypothetical protein [Undibacterium sp. RTI2.2]MEB0232669.1 hypothetical protein [Undibacterium sp. 10I3]MEB0258649.1 hypothetical protein [Undibacterium sp. 5I1]